MGVVCDNAPPGLTPQLAKDALTVNARFHLLAGAIDNPEAMRVWQDDYASKLVPSLRQTVDSMVESRQETVRAKVAVAATEDQTLSAQPAWGKPVFMLDFSTLPPGQPFVSPANPDPFEETDGLFRIRAHGNTYAYLKMPLQSEISGFVVLVRQSTDMGMSWGPGCAVTLARRRGHPCGIAERRHVSSRYPGQADGWRRLYRAAMGVLAGALVRHARSDRAQQRWRSLRAALDFHAWRRVCAARVRDIDRESAVQWTASGFHRSGTTGRMRL